MPSSTVVGRHQRNRIYDDDVEFKYRGSLQDILVQLSLWLHLVQILIYCYTVNSCALHGVHSMFFSNVPK